jgi:hypothetical protein
MNTGGRHRRPHPVILVFHTANRWVVEALVVVLVGSLIYLGATGVQSANRANCCFPLAMMELPPALNHPDYLTVTAAQLNQTQPQRPDYPLQVRYVGADDRSNGSTIISVNPIDQFTWAAVAVGSDGRCYATLSVLDPNHPSYGNTYYARFPTGTPCRGSEATQQTVTLSQLPEGVS